MHLSPREVQRFYSVWFPLLHYVNNSLRVVPHFPQTWQNAGVESHIAIRVRNALWEHDALRKAFITENPANLSQEDLALVESWEHRVSGNFFILRHLRKYSVFLGGEAPSEAYGVLGITSSIEETVGAYLPIYVQAVLLPFEERIIYDSLLSSYPIHFGAGMRQDLNASYRDIQERQGITLTLLPSLRIDNDPKQVKKAIQARNTKILKAFQKDLGQAGLSPQKIEEHTAQIADFAQAFLLSGSDARGVLEITLDDLEAYFSSTPKPNRVSFKRFIRFLQGSGRMDWEQAEQFLKFIKAGSGEG